jgi:hypothetical protein
LDTAIDVFVEKHPHSQTSGLFANPAFENRPQTHASGFSMSRAVIRALGLGLASKKRGFGAGAASV